MPTTITVNVPPYDGEYELDMEAKAFSYVEWRWVKKISGYTVLDIDEGWSKLDPDLILTLAIVAMYRSGKIAKNEALMVAEVIEDAPFDGAAISISDSDAEEVDPPSGSVNGASPSSSGADTSGSTEPSPASSSPSPTGTPDSDTGSESDRLTLAT